MDSLGPLMPCTDHGIVDDLAASLSFDWPKQLHASTAPSITLICQHIYKSAAPAAARPSIIPYCSNLDITLALQVAVISA